MKKRHQQRWQLKRPTMVGLFRELAKIETQVALLRLDLQAAGCLPKPKIEVKLCTCAPRVIGPHSVTVSASDWQCPIHGGLMKNASTAKSSVHKGEF